MYSSFAVMCGAPTINYTNIYPNLELWNRLDPTGKYNDVYNRYTHITIEFTLGPTEFELVGADYMNIKLSYEDIEQLDAKYILSDHKMESAYEGISFKQLYNESGPHLQCHGNSPVVGVGGGVRSGDLRALRGVRAAGAAGTTRERTLSYGPNC